MSTTRVIRCTKGDPLRFRARVAGQGGGVPSISTGYDVAKFQARASLDDSDSSILLQAGTADSSIVISAPDGTTGDITVDVFVGRDQTEATGVTKVTPLFGRLRLYQSGDATQSLSIAVPISLEPDPIDNG
jgi:hypothetical protein